MRPNIIYMLSDQHNPRVMGCAGDQYVRTPNLDRLRCSSTMLNNCYCASPLCVPSRSALLTGLLPTHTGVYNNMQCLPSDKATFPTLLTVSGYETVLSGRMHFVGPDQRHGFEKRFVGDITPCYIGGDNEEEIYGEFKRSSGQNLTSIKKSGAGHSAVLDFDKDVAETTCKYLRERNDERPLFMVAGFYGPHCPYIAPKDLYDYYYQLLPELPALTQEEQNDLHPAIRQWRKNRKMEVVIREDVRRIRAAYYAMVEYEDYLIGTILGTVRETIGLENTVIIYTSDHGDNIGEHGLFWKTNFYEGAARVPAMISWPGHLPCGKTVQGLTSLVDIAPTILELAQAPELPACDGESLLAYIENEKQPDPERLVASVCSDIKGDAPSAMLRKGSYKFVRHAGYAARQLFDLLNDPEEQLDLGGKKDYAELVRQFDEMLKAYWDEDKIIGRLELDKLHFRYMKRWYEIVNPSLIDEWRGKKENNYLL